MYDTLYCERGQAENLIKLHKSQLASDRTSWRAPLASQMRLILHTAAYWLLLSVRDGVPKAHARATAEFTTLRLRLMKIAGQVIETASRVRIALRRCLSCGDIVPRTRPQLAARSPVNAGASAPSNPSPINL